MSAGRIDEAKSFFGEMKEGNILTWTVMISGLAQNGYGEKGLKLFSQMRLEGFEPCDYAFAGAITYWRMDASSMLNLFNLGMTQAFQQEMR